MSVLQDAAQGVWRAGCETVHLSTARKRAPHNDVMRLQKCSLLPLNNYTVKNLFIFNRLHHVHRLRVTFVQHHKLLRTNSLWRCREFYMMKVTHSATNHVGTHWVGTW